MDCPVKLSVFRCLLAFCCLAAIPTLSITQVPTREWEEWDSRFLPGRHWSTPWNLNYNGYSKADALILRSKWDLIAAANPDSNDEWAGDYYNDSEFRLIALRWSPQFGFAAVNLYTCTISVMRFNYGRVAASPNLVELFPEFSSKPLKGKNSISNYLPTSKHLPVKWGERHYLIPEDNVKDFCDYVAGFGRYVEYEPFHEGQLYSTFLLKSSDYDKPKEGLPILPPSYQRFVKNPIDATITAVGRSWVKKSDNDDWFEDQVTRVTLSVGSIQGVKVGMRFRVPSSERSETVKITRVLRNRAQGIIVRNVRKNSTAEANERSGDEEPEFPPITVGWKLSTSPHKK
jgi:hypothetical protein